MNKENWDLKEYQIVRFYPYETGAFRDDMIAISKEGSNPTLENTFENLIERVSKILGRDVRDNKVAVETIDKATRERIFFGWYDYYHYAARAIRPREGWCGEPVEIIEEGVGA